MRKTKVVKGTVRQRVAMLTLCLLALFIVPAFSAPATDEARTAIPAGDSPSLGPKDAPVTIIKFTDYQ